MPVLYWNSRIFVIPVYIFNGRKQTLVDTIRILSALRMRGLHNKRHLLAKLHIAVARIKMMVILWSKDGFYMKAWMLDYYCNCYFIFYLFLLWLLLVIWQSPGLRWWRKVNWITVTYRPHHRSIHVALSVCQTDSTGFLPASFTCVMRDSPVHEQ